MEQPVSLQLIKAAATLLCGVALGVAYDVLRVPRYRGGRVLAALCDVLFCLIAAAALFSLGLGPGGGELRLYMFPLCYFGAVMSSALFGPWTRAAAGLVWDAGGKIWRFLTLPLKKCGERIKKLGKYLKKLFSCGEKWFTIIYHHTIGRVVPRRPLAKEKDHEAQEVQHFYPDRDPGADRVRHHQHRSDPRKN